MTKLESKISMLEEYIESIKPDTKNHIYADKDALITLINDIKNALPEDLKIIPKLLEEASLARDESRKEAKKFIDDAKAKREEMINSSSQVQMANDRANDIIQQASFSADTTIKNAQKEALKVYEQAIKYYINSTKECQKQLENIVVSFAPVYNTFYQNIENNYKTLDAKRMEKEGELNNISSQISAMDQLVMQENNFNSNVSDAVQNN